MADADLEIGAPSASPELTQGSPELGWLVVSGSPALEGSPPLVTILHSLTPEYQWRAMRLLMTVYAGMEGVGWSRMGEGWGQQAFLARLGLGLVCLCSRRGCPGLSPP